MTKEPELPNFVRDLEILESLDRLEYPLARYSSEPFEDEGINKVEEGFEGLTS